MACNIIYEGNNIVVTEDNGSPSQIFEIAKSFYGNQKDALNLWLTTKTEDFEREFETEDYSFNDVLRYVNMQNTNIDVVSQEELRQIRDVMDKSGIASLSEMGSILNTIFKPNGILDFDERVALDSGIYTREDLDKLDIREVGEVLNRIDATLKATDVEIEPSGTNYDYVSSGETTIIGTARKMSLEEVSDVLTDEIEPGLSDGVFMFKLQELPFNKIVDRALSDTNYRNELKESIDRTRKVEKLEIGPDGVLRVSESDTFSTVKSTLPVGTNTVELKGRLNTLKGFTDFAWTQQEDIKKVLKKNSEIFAKYNIDLAGLETLSNSSTEVELLMTSAINVLDNPSNTSIQQFSELKDQLLGKESPVAKVKLSENYDGLNIVRVESTMTDEAMFTEHGLIKIQDNYYHKVDKDTSIEDTYELLYDMYLAADFSIPNELITERNKSNPSNKPQVMEDISTFINSRETNLDLNESRELVSALQVAFGHSAIPSTPRNKKLANAINTVTEVAEIEDSFIPDFYNYYIEEKIKNSRIYKDVLSKLKFTEKGIVPTDRIESLEGIQDRVRLEDYIRLRRDSDMNHLVNQSELDVTEDLFAINYPNTVSEYTGESFLKGNRLITPRVNRNFVRIGNRLFRKNFSENGQSLFQEVDTSKDPIFLKGSTNFEYDFEEAQEFFESHQILTRKSTAERNAEVLEMAKLSPVDVARIEESTVTTASVEVQNPIDLKTDLNEQPSSLSDMNEGMYYTDSDQTLFKGKEGKFDLEGQRINAHEGVEGVFAALDVEVAEQYGEVSEMNVPSGTIVEVVKVDPKGKTPGEFREDEVRLINESNADIVKLMTMDGVMRAGEEFQEQYIVKDRSIIPTTGETSEMTVEVEGKVNGYDTILSKVGDRVIGKLRLIEKENTMEVDQVTVVPEYRGQGVATSMYELAMQASIKKVVSVGERTEGSRSVWESLVNRGLAIETESGFESMPVDRTIDDSSNTYNEDLSQDMLSILNSEVELLDLYPTSKQDEIDGRVDECGG
jgi:predicted GNAT family acetyltransferase